MIIVVNVEKIKKENPRLTERELHVLVQVLSGVRQTQICKDLGLQTPNGVHHQVRLMYATFNVDSMIELGYVAYERGYVTIEEA